MDPGVNQEEFSKQLTFPLASGALIRLDVLDRNKFAAGKTRGVLF